MDAHEPNRAIPPARWRWHSACREPGSGLAPLPAWPPAAIQAFIRQASSTRLHVAPILRPQPAALHVALAGICRLGPVRLIVSHAMLDTLEFVLRRMAVTSPFAAMA